MCFDEMGKDVADAAAPCAAIIARCIFGLACSLFFFLSLGSLLLPESEERCE